MQTKRALIVGIFSLLLLLSAGMGVRHLVAADEDDLLAERTITVSGQAEIRAVPDTATLTVGVSILAKTADKAQKEAAQKAAALIETLKKKGIPEKSIQTINFSLNAEYDYSDRQRTLLGYRAVHELSVIVEDLANLGSVMDAVVAGGGNTINNVRFGLRNSRDVAEEALRRAVADAQRKAEILAEAAGAGAVRIVAVQENSSYPVPKMGGSERYAAVALDQATPVMPGEVVVGADVQVEFRF
ncbi:MAG TPA: SIMPL domain-containing protein [Firmicutes bacterium]|nr:SIMPL domain-containing protein [Bacillota bacterium]